MTTDLETRCDPADAAAALIAVSTVFASLGRGLLCLDSTFRIVHASTLLEQMLGTDAAQSLPGRPVEALLGAELFGEAGAIRMALESGERREGWRAFIHTDGNHHVLSITAAPFVPDPGGICDRRVAYIIVVRPADEDVFTGTSAPTVFSGLIARSPAMRQIFQLVENLQSTDATVLLTGESGTGKEVVARAIHAHSPRREGPFVALNCGALPGELLESELFGHVRGAFTGAIRDRVGRFELASHGTIFLDEIGDLPIHLQVKLLRVIQERTFERVGESRSRTTDARIIAATHIDLRRAVNEGKFRDDLYYRLRVVPIEIPPLRDRREDIEPLARYLLARVGARHGRQLLFSPETIRALLGYSWPGNVRELENAIEYAVAVGKGQTIVPEDLPSEILATDAGPRLQIREPAQQDSEQERIRLALEHAHWRREDAAKELGMSRTTLWRRMRELHLE